jgi:PAS domain S-box-containing protein
MAMTCLQDDTDLQLYRLLVEAVVDYAIYLLDAEGRISTWNTGAARIKGYAAEEVTGRSFAMFFTEEDRRDGVPARALEVARREGRFETEGWRLRKDGTRFWALAVLDAVRSPTGEVVGFAKITRDITERHAAQQALLESERRFRLLVEGVTDYAIFMLHPDGRVANWNPGARRIKGYEAAEIVGSHFSRFYAPEDVAAGLPARALAQAAATGRFEAEAWRLRQDGTRFWASVVIDAIRDPDGALLGFAKITRDLTERRKAQQALEETRAQLVQAQKLEALGQLTGGVAHDFNNVLQVVTAGISLAEKLPPGDAKLGRILAEMRNATLRAAQLTSQLLAFSRRAPLRPERIDTGEVLQQALELVRRSLPVRIRLEVALEAGLWPLRVDVAHFEMAVLNVAVNARDAMEGEGELRVTARNVTLAGQPQGLSGRFVAVGLRDTGAGIPAEILSRVFEPFFTTKPVGKGTGLGLSQVHGFAQQAGGGVAVETAVGVGTEITLYLPAVEAAGAEGAAAEEPTVTAPAQRRLRILIVDDDPAVGRLTLGMLEGAGHQATVTTDPLVALRLLEKGQEFDVLLSDVVMPGGMNGMELARTVRARWSHMPVLLATGYAGEEPGALADVPMLYKPFTALELGHAIAAAMRGAPT